MSLSEKEIEMAKMVARRNGTDFDIYADGFNIGRLADCEICHVFQSEDKELEGYIGDCIEGDMSVREMLAEIRKGYESVQALKSAPFSS